MDENEVLRAAGQRTAPFYVYDCVDSTNTVAKTLARQGAVSGTAVTAGCQTAGRGRMGRSFSSPAGQGVYLSVIYRPQLPAERLPVFTAWAAVAVCRAVERLCGARAEIKWTNDVLLHGRKLCGILTESSVGLGGAEFIVVGAGVNLNRRKEDFPPELQETATSLLLETGQEIRPETAAGILAAELDAVYAGFLAAGGGVPEAYVRRCTTLGRTVTYTADGEVRAGRAEAIGPGGQLIVRRETGGTDTLGWGEVSVRPV